ncbi:ABC-type dipeptide/oligopeptide/nickel transport system, permease component [Saccharomonospora marina XMU15]|uniref:ABC-type dipeptide/oligopeptide/nickel transport system, permease component n=1 Tax=Saccharomonospora marina XMU15 TaxID=882083 RepID=H5WYQ4_9PSEU|nr:ABC transporter permease [Saccharomonospora marina]EHR50719.1 ABC-type dipeptide/oligopeptide/nickel transport system, permease component [Saccharomonospora marina XMU15]
MSNDLSTDATRASASGRSDVGRVPPPPPRRRNLADAWAGFKRFLRTEPLGAVSLVLITLIVLVAVLAPLVAPYDPLLQNRTRITEGPSSDFWLGTDDLGRDVLSRLIYGARSSMIIGVVTTAASLVLGTVFGVVSGFLGRRKDLVIQRVMDSIQSVPPLVLLLFMAVVLTPSIQGTIIALVIVITPSFNRVARAETLRIREEPYIEAARATGAGALRIMGRHVLPNMAAPLLTMSSLLFAGVIIAESALSFLGIGTPPPTPSWGLMLSEGVRYVEMAPWMVIAPGIVLSLAVFAFNLLGDALRDFLDPRLHR